MLKLYFRNARLRSIFETLVLENQYKIVAPIFGAPNKDTTILYWFRSLSTVLHPVEKSRIQGHFKALQWFSTYFSTFQESPLNSSTFQACANPVPLIFFSCWCFYADISSRADGHNKFGLSLHPYIQGILCVCVQGRLWRVSLHICAALSEHCLSMH